VQQLGLVDYATTYSAMQSFTAARAASLAQHAQQTPDELWLCQHPAVYTQGLAGKPEHLIGQLNSAQTLDNHAHPTLAVIQTDRGGQVTYHGAGQWVAYPLVHLHRLGIFVKEYVYRLEEAALATLAHYGITAHRVAGAPGLYVRLNEPFGHAALPKGDAKQPDFTGLGKIAALGIKVSRGCTYHGLSLNVAMDLQPFAAINPCGYAGLVTVDMASFGLTPAMDEVGALLASKIVNRFTVPI
jgi:lipoyl(octanoyl) transferase